MDVYEYKQEFQVRHCESDFKHTLKTSIALSYMQEVACASADELGYGYQYLWTKGYSFIIANICCEFCKPIRLGDRMQIKTWPLPPSHVIFGREYQFLSLTGEILANASSRWCLLDMTNGKLLSSKVLVEQDYSKYNTTKVLNGIQWKIPVFSLAEGELCFSIKIANSEYDHNMHVNNTRYADYCMNCFSVEELSKRFISRFQITYVKQCKEGEVLRFYRKQVAEEEYLVQGVNELEETVVTAKIHFSFDGE